MFISVAMPSAASASASANTDSINTIYAFNLMFFAIALVAVFGGFTLHFIGHVLFKAPNARCPVCNAFIAVVGCLHRARVMQPAAFSDEEKSIHAAHSAVLRSTYLALKTDVEERLGPSLGLSATVTNSASENVKNIAPETQYQSLPRDQDGDDVPSIVVASPSTDVLAPVSTHNLPDYDLLSADSTAYAPETMLDHLHALHNAAYLLANEAQEATDERPSCPIVDSLSCDDSFELSYLPSAFGAHEEYDDAAAQTSGSSTLSHGDSFEMNDASFEDVDLLEDGAHTLGGTWSAALPSSSSEDDILLLEQLAQIHRSGEDREHARPGCPIASTLSHDDSLAHLASSQDAVDDTEYAEFEADLTSSSTISLAEFAETHTDDSDGDAVQREDALGSEEDSPPSTPQLSGDDDTDSDNDWDAETDAPLVMCTSPTFPDFIAAAEARALDRCLLHDLYVPRVRQAPPKLELQWSISAAPAGLGLLDDAGEYDWFGSGTASSF